MHFTICLQCGYYWGELLILQFLVLSEHPGSQNQQLPKEFWSGVEGKETGVLLSFIFFFFKYTSELPKKNKNKK